MICNGRRGMARPVSVVSVVSVVSTANRQPFSLWCLPLLPPPPTARQAMRSQVTPGHLSRLRGCEAARIGGQPAGTWQPGAGTCLPACWPTRSPIAPELSASQPFREMGPPPPGAPSEIRNVGWRGKGAIAKWPWPQRSSLR